ncbi:glycosyltransferase [Pseudoroseicyclus aestuarii]|uniref:Glycosyltransferase involved in cell wall biosynthesis n=1 Tax=Pseudoroseicyclus aestuarii TaxID=1795041 RepID=A0A318SSI7_9RHOB|nr:glycosyltransferase [Pseudoroseicyclus aestuarii]PYE82232.1 glycosyltransferase involved in cell wall biosynthesis [Pseudoroseicyclus aestuarii]
MTLAIAAESFTGPSITFIRDHVRHVAPGRTILLSRAREDLSDMGCQALTGLLPPPRGSLEARTRRLGRMLRRKFTGVSPVSLPARRSAEAAGFLREHGAQALLTEYLTEGVRFMDAADRAGVPLYAHAHGFDATTLAQDPIWRQAYDRLFEQAAGILAPSQYLAQRVADLGCPADKITVSPCGIDPGSFSRTRRHTGKIVTVGRFVEKKGPQHSIAAFARAAAAHPEAWLDMIGDGPLLESCQALAHELGVADRITFHGAQPSTAVSKVIGEASLFMQHSVIAKNGDTEGLPVAILEAMASALPVVATRHSGIPEAVIHGETGLLVDEGDVGAMAEAIRALLGDPERARTMGEAGLERVQARFTHGHTRDRILTATGLA